MKIYNIYNKNYEQVCGVDDGCAKSVIVSVISNQWRVCIFCKRKRNRKQWQLLNYIKFGNNLNYRANNSCE